MEGSDWTARRQFCTKLQNTVHCRFVPRDILPLGTFCPWERFVLGRFVRGNVLSWGVLSWNVLSWDVLSVGTFRLGTFCRGTFCIYMCIVYTTCLQHYTVHCTQLYSMVWLSCENFCWDQSRILIKTNIFLLFCTLFKFFWLTEI